MLWYCNDTTNSGIFGMWMCARVHKQPNEMRQNFNAFYCDQAHSTIRQMCWHARFGIVLKRQKMAVSNKMNSWKFRLFYWNCLNVWSRPMCGCQIVCVLCQHKSNEFSCPNDKLYFDFILSLFPRNDQSCAQYRQMVNTKHCVPFLNFSFRWRKVARKNFTSCLLEIYF